MSEGLVSQAVRLGTGRGVAKLLSFAAFLLIARSLGPGRFGEFIFAFTVGSLLIFIPNMGADPYFSREVPHRESARDLLGRVLGLKIVGSAVFLGIYLGLMSLITTSPVAQKAAVFVGLALILLAFTSTWKTVLITRQQAGMAGIVDVAQAGAFLALVLLVVIASPSVVAAAQAFLAGQIVGVAIGAAIVIHRVGLARIPTAISAYSGMTRSALSLMLIWFVSDLYLRVDTAILYLLKGDLETGLYGASYRLVEGVYAGAIVVCTTALPRLSRGWSEGDTLWRREWGAAVRLMLAVVVPPAIAFAMFPDTIIGLLYGDEFATASRSLRWLGPATFFLCLSYLYGASLTSLGEEYRQLKVAVLALATNLVLNLLLIPPLAGVGAALATLVSAAVYVAVARHLARRVTSSPRPALDTRPAVSSR